MSLADANADRLRNQEVEDLRSILKTVYGKRFIWKWLGRSGIFRQSFMPGAADSTAFNEGRRSIGNALLAEVLEVRPDSYSEMVKYAKEEEDARRTIADAGNDNDD